MSDPFIGEIRVVGFNFAPVGWALCNGQLLAISQNQALFALIGVTYGGNGTTNFALPNLQGRVAIHQGQSPGTSPYTIGQSAGVENVTLTTAQLPSHSHGVNASTSAPGVGNPANNFLVTGDRTTPINIYTSTSGPVLMNPNMITPTGSNQPVPVLSPYLCVNFIIALQGIFPSRG